MSAGISFTTFASLDRTKNEPFELGSVQWIRRFGEGDREALACGYWHITPDEAPEPFELLIDADETILILQGRITVEVKGGIVYDLTPGCAASLNKGAQTTWTILEPTVEFFVYS